MRNVEHCGGKSANRGLEESMLKVKTLRLIHFSHSGYVNAGYSSRAYVKSSTFAFPSTIP